LKLSSSMHYHIAAKGREVLSKLRPFVAGIGLY